MGFPKIVVDDRQVILLSGYETTPESNGLNGASARVAIAAEDKLRLAVKKNPGAVAFGYVVGEWMAGA
jgi:hypothetical protein